MSFYAGALLDLIRRRFEGNQHRFSKATGIDPSMVSRQCSGISLPDSSTIRKTISGLPPADGAELVVAYLRDICPPSVRALVEINTKPKEPVKEITRTLQPLLDVSELPTRDVRIAEEMVRWIKVDPAASAFLSHALSLMRPPRTRGKRNVN